MRHSKWEWILKTIYVLQLRKRFYTILIEYKNGVTS